MTNVKRISVAREMADRATCAYTAMLLRTVSSALDVPACVARSWAADCELDFERAVKRGDMAQAACDRRAAEALGELAKRLEVLS